MKPGSESFALSRVKWDLFCTLTFAGAVVKRPVSCRKILFAWLRETSGHLGIWFPKLAWAVRSEHGGLGGRFHFHALIAGVPGLVDRALCLRSMNTWEGCGGGMARVRPFDDSLPGVSYVLKGISDCSGRSGYELARFGNVGEVTLSLALMAATSGRSVVRGWR